MITTLNAAEITLIDEPRPFQIDELFFSTTDKKGRIEKANDVFVRVSGFPAAELQNKPHNIIRHPEMPRIVFRILWEHIEDSRPVVAYVKNRAKDGRYYWVVALVSPTANGYLSVRFKPSSALWPKVEGLYRRLRQIEQSVEQSENGKQAAMIASAKELDTQLRSLGFGNYDDFMNVLLQEELQSREAGLGRIRADSNFSEADSQSTEGNTFYATSQSCGQLLKRLNHVFGDLTVYVALNSQIRSKCEFVTSLSMSIRILALNGAIEAKKLGSLACGIGKVLDWLQSLSNSITSECENLSKALVLLISEVKAIIFNLGWAKLQTEMTGSFASELMVRQASFTKGVEEDRRMTDGAMEILHTSFNETTETTRRALASLSAANTDLQQLRRTLGELQRSTSSLRSIYVTGKIEMAALKSSQMGFIFSNLGTQLTNAETNLSDLNEQIEKLHGQLQKTVGAAAGINALLTGVNEALTAI